MRISWLPILTAIAIAACGSAPAAIAPPVPPRVASLARGMAASLGDRHVKTA